eukprot:2596517-Pleurochrysis_carterae.AAC.3
MRCARNPAAATPDGSTVQAAALTALCEQPRWLRFACSDVDHDDALCKQERQRRFRALRAA